MSQRVTSMSSSIAAWSNQWISTVMVGLMLVEFTM
uniref:Uncharacterized protein n=1 Tax=Arundo donax TaxID=35708 RepID=A0A0A9BNX8_ARUDO